MSKLPEPIWTELGPGYKQVQFHDLKQFIEYVYNDMLNYGAYIWRGQRSDSWKLEPTIERLVREENTTQTKEWDFQKKHLEAFQHAARGRRGFNPSAIHDENEWWSLGQHHGLATPLLDWTNSPFVAAFFAFSELGSAQTPNRAIFALHQPRVESIVKNLKQKADILYEARKEERIKSGAQLGIINSNRKPQPDLIFVKPMSDENQRLVSQGGLFTRSRTNLSIEDWIMNHHQAEDKGITLLKCVIPDDERARCLQFLNRMNINPLSLFPDLTGASRYCNLFSEIENY
jgi:FRG domain